MMCKNLSEMMQIEEDLATNLFEVLDKLYPTYEKQVPSSHELIK